MLKTRKHNGVTYFTIEGGVVEAALTTGDDKFVLTGTVALEEIKGSYKFGHQMQVTAYTQQPVVKQKRVNGKTYNRVEIFIPYKMWKEMVKA